MNFNVGSWLVRPDLNSVVRDGAAQHVTPKAMDLLVFLAGRRGGVCSRAEIIETVWAGAFVTDDALTRCIGELRRALGQTQDHVVIETVAKRGYRIALPIVFESEERVPPSDEPETKREGSGTHRTRRRVLAIGGLGAVTTLLLLRPWRGRTPYSPQRVRSIAVLPLLNLSGDPSQEYFCDGMTELLTSKLSKVGALRVTSRTSAMTFKGSRKPLKEIAQQLHVDAVVEGSASRSGNRVRVVAQLIDASSDVHLWSETYERDYGDILGLQAEVAEAIVRQIMIKTDRTARASHEARINTDSYEPYLKGMFHLNKFTPEGFEMGMSYLRQAVEKDPADPFAYASMALGYAILGHDRYPDALLRAKTAAIRSIELGGPVAEAVAALGMAELYSDWDLERAGQHLEKALQIQPNFAEALRNYSWYLRLRGRYQEALEAMKRATQLEPLVPLFPADLAWQSYEEGHLDAAMREAEKSVELNSGFAQGLAVAGWVLTERGRFDEALSYHRKAASADAAWKWPLGQTCALAGRQPEALEIASAMQKSPGPMEAWGLAVIYAALKRPDEAFRWLDRAYQSRFSWMPWIADFSRRPLDLFTPLRDDSRFADLIRRIGIPPIRKH